MGGLCRSWECWHTGTGRSLAPNLLKVVALLLARPGSLCFATLVKRLVSHLWAFRIAVSEEAAEVPLKDPKLRTYGNLEFNGLLLINKKHLAPINLRGGENNEILVNLGRIEECMNLATLE